MKKLTSLFMSFIVAVSLLCSSVGAAWVEYDMDSAMHISTTVTKAKLNKDGSVYVQIVINNYSGKEAVAYSLYDAIVYFGLCSIDISDCIKSVTIPPSSQKKYTVKIAARKVPTELTTDDMTNFRYDFCYVYDIGSFHHDCKQTIKLGQK